MVTSHRTQVVFRTHKWTSVQDFLVDQIREATQGEAIVVYDASHGYEQGYPRDVSYPIDLAWLQRNGLFPVKKWGWRAGDYALYRAAEVCDPFDHMLMLDSDVFIHWPGFDGILEELSDVPDDLLSLHIEMKPGPRRLAMLAHPVLDSMKEKRSCLFGLIRASKRLIDHAFELRQEYSKEFKSADAPFANDESVLATLAASYAEYTVRQFNEVLPPAVDVRFKKSDHFKMSDFDLSQLKRAIIHPLASMG